MPIRFVARRIERFFIYRVLHVDDTPHRIALGVAIGIFVTWTPTIGLQMVLTIALATLLRANKFVGVPFVWISNPATLWLYYPNYKVGRWMLPGDYPEPDFLKAIVLTGGWPERIRTFWETTSEILAPLWIGSIVVALVLGAITYVVIRYAVVNYRNRLELRRLRRRRAAGR